MIVKINADVYAYYEYQCPSYRIWVDDTLYNEREFWTDCLSNYIQEEMHVDLEPGMHSLTIEKISSPHAKIWIEKAVVETENKNRSGKTRGAREGSGLGIRGYSGVPKCPTVEPIPARFTFF
jgi:hypothetical protein